MKSPTFKTLFLAFLFFLFGLKVSTGEEAGHPHEPHEDSTEISKSSVGPDMAILQASRDQGFKLSDAAWIRLGIQTTPLKTTEPFSVPSSALVFYQDQIGVFRLRNGWFRLIPIKLLKQSPEIFQIASPDLQKEDAVAIQGVGFLRIAEMEVFGEASGGHVH